jgi:hypothetical protein
VTVLLGYVAVSSSFCSFNWFHCFYATNTQINGFRNHYRPPTVGNPRWRFLRTNVDYFFLSLLVSDLVQSVGSIMDIRWVAAAKLSEGSFCTAQGVIKQVGDVGVALASLAIATHTFSVLFFRWTAPQGRWLPLTILAFIWLFLVLITSVSARIHQNPPFYGPSTYWCWVC